MFIEFLLTIFKLFPSENQSLLIYWNAPNAPIFVLHIQNRVFWGNVRDRFCIPCEPFHKDLESSGVYRWSPRLFYNLLETDRDLDLNILDLDRPLVPFRHLMLNRCPCRFSVI